LALPLLALPLLACVAKLGTLENGLRSAGFAAQRIKTFANQRLCYACAKCVAHRVSAWRNAFASIQRLRTHGGLPLGSLIILPSLLKHRLSELRSS